MVNDRIDQSSGETMPPSDQIDLIAPEVPAAGLIPTPSSSAGLTEDSECLPSGKATNLIDHEFDWPAWLRNQGEAGDMQSPPD